MGTFFRCELLPNGAPMHARKLFGDHRGAVALLTPLEGPGPLIVAESIETALAVAGQFAAAGRPFRALATISLANLQGDALGYRDKAGFRLDAPECDPERSPFVVPNAGDVVVVVDPGLPPLQARVCITPRAAPCMRLLSSIERAELCAVLAAQAWTKAGASSVRIVRPRAGQSLSDAVGEVL
jgi:hypothetical protein